MTASGWIGSPAASSSSDADVAVSLVTPQPTTTARSPGSQRARSEGRTGSTGSMPSTGTDRRTSATSAPWVESPSKPGEIRISAGRRTWPSPADRRVAPTTTRNSLLVTLLRQWAAVRTHTSSTSEPPQKWAEAPVAPTFWSEATNGYRPSGGGSPSTTRADPPEPEKKREAGSDEASP